MAAAGSVRVGLLDEAGQPLAGVGLADCDPIRADSTRKKMTWNGEGDLGHLAGEVVRLRLELREAKLFALQFVP